MAEAEEFSVRLLEKLELELSKVINVANKSEFLSLRNELNILLTSIREAESCWKLQDPFGVNDEFMLWVSQMKKVASLIHIVLELLLPYHGFVSRVGFAFGQGDLVSKVKEIKVLIFKIKKGIGAAIVDQNLPRTYHWRDEVPIQQIRNYLVSKEPELFPLVLVDGNEIAKINLAKIYNSKTVRRDFDCCAWITFPDSLLWMSDNLKFLVKQLCENEGDIDAMNDDELRGALKHCLQLKRYLLVLDNVWHIEFLFDLSHHKLSRIIITTDNTSYFRKFEKEKPPNCDRFELCIEYAGPNDEYRTACVDVIKIGYSFNGEYDLIWRTVLKFLYGRRKKIKNYGVQVEPNSNPRSFPEVVDIFSCQTQSCLLYFSIFPLDSWVPNNKLFKLWIAEGFVQEQTGKSLEEVAQEYLDELINMELVESCQGFYGIENFSRVHCLVDKMLLKLAVECNFCQIPGAVDEESSFRGKIRRLLISNHNLESVLQDNESYYVRSVFVSNVDALNSSILVRLFEKFKLLTLLDIEDSPLDLVPDEVGNLICLKYLNLKKTKVRMLPKSVRKLEKLQTLDLTNTLVVELPMEIFMLRNLRHLLASRCDNKISLDSAKAVRIKPGIGYLINLQSLMTVEAHLSGMDVIQELKKLRQLRSLSVSRMTTELSRALCSCIKQMSHLESLRLHSMNNESLDLRNISSPPPHLQRLVLKGSLPTFPVWISSLENLTVLGLSLSMLADDPLQHLCSLPNLESLWLYRAYEGQILHFEEGGFKKLKLLVLRDLQRLESVDIGEGALSLLEELRIGPSLLLNEVPDGIKHLSNLKVVSFYDMSREFVLNMKPDVGPEYAKVQHVPSVLIWYRDNGRRYVSYQLGQEPLWQRLEWLNLDSTEDLVQQDSRLSLCYSDDEEDSALTSSAQWNSKRQLSFASDRFSFFTDDVEE